MIKCVNSIWVRLTVKWMDIWLWTIFDVTQICIRNWIISSYCFHFTYFSYFVNVWIGYQRHLRHQLQRNMKVKKHWRGWFRRTPILSSKIIIFSYIAYGELKIVTLLFCKIFGGQIYCLYDFFWVKLKNTLLVELSLTMEVLSEYYH